MVEKFAVIGNPIEHSKSPQIHQAFARQMGKHIIYERILAPLDQFAVTVSTLISDNYRGANVTVPFKFEAFAICHSLSNRAINTHAEAVNTLTFKDGKILGDNTDGVGLLNDIEQNLGFKISGKRVLVLGAGGAAQGVLMHLSAAAHVTVANRTFGKAQAMVARLDTNQYSACQFSALNEAYDLIINATSTGLSDVALPISDSVFSSHSLAYDMMYGRDTPFMQQAIKAGALVADGLGMLVEQAAEAFYAWHGVRPDTKPVMTMLRTSLG